MRTQNAMEEMIRMRHPTSKAWKSSKQPSLGPTRYRAQDGKSDYAAIITKVDGFECCLTVWLPNVSIPSLLTRVRFDPDATPETAKPGTCYQW